MRLPIYLGLGDVIDIYSKPDQQTASGGWTDEWPLFAEHVACDIVPTSAQEVNIDDRMQTQLIYEIILPASLKGLLSSMMAKWKGHELYFTAIMPEVAENGVQIVNARERLYDDDMAEMA